LTFFDSRSYDRINLARAALSPKWNKQSRFAAWKRRGRKCRRFR